jgi:diguanylate cyclase (GGDEF)-like protein
VIVLENPSLTEPSPQVTAKTNVAAALELWRQLRQNRPQDAVPQLEAALEVARCDGDRLGLGQVLVALGQAASLTSQGANALRYAEEALELLQPLPSATSDVIAALRVVGRVQYDFGNDDRALEVFQEALQLVTEPLERLPLQSNIAAIQIELGKYQQAIETYENLIPLAMGVQDDHQVAHMRGNHALAWKCLAHRQTDPALKEHHLRRALEEAEAALAGARATDEQSLQAHTHRTIAEMLLEQDRLEDAKDHLRQSLSLARATQSASNEIHTLHYLAHVALREQHPEQALEYLQEALPRATTLGLQDHVAQIHERFAEVHEALGDHRQALTHARQGFDLHLQVRSETANRRAEALAAQWQLERARLEARFERERAETLARLNEQLAQQALTDGLTGVPNRRALVAHLERVHAAALRGSSGFTVVLLDLDHFKQINDTHSHAVGDAVLRRVGQILLETCRKGDYVARFGGEEFALVLDQTSERAAFELCERLRARLEREPWAHLRTDPRAELRVTASFGYCAQYTLESFESILSVADEHLYAAKNAGRNRVHPIPH